LILITTKELDRFGDGVGVRALDVPVTEALVLPAVVLPAKALEAVELSPTTTPALVYPDGQYVDVV